MLQYQIKSSLDTQVVVDGLVVLSPGEAVTLTEEQIHSFETVRGLKLNQGNLPDGVELTVVVKDGE